MPAVGLPDCQWTRWCRCCSGWATRPSQLPRGIRVRGLPGVGRRRTRLGRQNCRCGGPRLRLSRLSRVECENYSLVSPSHESTLLGCRFRTSRRPPVGPAAPFFAVTVFTYERHPDLPRTGYADGKLGVVLPSYARSYLVVAWRHVAGIGFDPREREQLLGYWTDRETAHWDKIDVDWQEHWTAASGGHCRRPPSPKPARSPAASRALMPTHQFLCV